MSDPIDEMVRVIEQTLAANALRLTTVRGGYVGGSQPHPTLPSDPGAVEAVARGLLARKVAEPSRVLSPTTDTPVSARVTPKPHYASQAEFGAALEDERDEEPERYPYEEGRS